MGHSCLSDLHHGTAVFLSSPQLMFDAVTFDPLMYMLPMPLKSRLRLQLAVRIAVPCSAQGENHTIDKPGVAAVSKRIIPNSAKLRCAELS